LSFNELILGILIQFFEYFLGCKRADKSVYELILVVLYPKFSEAQSFSLGCSFNSNIEKMEKYA
jgi:hypothetical protein